MDEDKDIDDLINELEIENIETKELKTTESNDVEEVDVTENEELMQEVFNMTIEDRQKADDAYNIFAPVISQGKDHTTASKEAMMKAIELKIASAHNIIEMMKLNKKGEPSVGIFMNNMIGEKKAGINIKNISDEIDD